MGETTGTDDRSGSDLFAAIVLGAGISGLVTASILLKQGYPNIVVVDEYDHIGGNHIDCRIGEFSLFYSFSGERGFKESVLYNVSHAGAWKRLTVYSDFYGRVGGREFFAVEVNADHVSSGAGFQTAYPG